MYVLRIDLNSRDEKAIDLQMITPIQRIYMPEINDRIFIKREDLLPFSFGGNKYRIASEYFADMKARGNDCIIGYGNARSNLCRVLANISAVNGVRCYIVSVADENQERPETSNIIMAEMCGGIIRYCDRQHVSETIQAVIDECRAQGLSPYYIHGDIYGKGNEEVPVRAYVNAYREICDQGRNSGIDFDYIFLATGTGMTQAGLIEGYLQSIGKEQIVGVSVARDKSRATESIFRYLLAYTSKHGLPEPKIDDVVVCDDYLCGGYGKFDEKVISTIRLMYKRNGIALDPVYTGKAFYGMCDYLRKNRIEDKNILFIHTGGLPIFFDNISLLKM